MINYKHLHYFWAVARQGGVARASEHLHLTPQTISGQISLLEDSLGVALFNKVGRNLELSEAGRQVLSYADEIFSLGGELEDTVRNLPSGRPLVFKVGIADVVPKTIAYRLLAPALQLQDTVRIICKENSLDSLLGELALHRIDMVLADSPIPPSLNIRGFSHSLGDCGSSFLANPDLARNLAGEFPQCLNGAPLLLPSDINQMQGRILRWLDSLHIHPKIVGEFDDSALMKAFGQAGSGIFISPSAIARENMAQYGVDLIGSTEDLREHFYAISVERKISHPAVAAITETAREWLK
jgi:LysR family transcriptional regulator, transcriptional activator of nhaA